MPARTEVLGDGTRGCEEPLGVARKLEPLHMPLPLAGGLVRILRPIVQVPVLPMFHTREDLPLGSSIALKFIGDDHAWYVEQVLEQLAEELLSRPLIPAALHHDIQHVPILIDCPPQIVMLALDGQKHLVDVPLVPRLGTATPELIRILLA